MDENHLTEEEIALQPEKLFQRPSLPLDPKAEETSKAFENFELNAGMEVSEEAVILEVDKSMSAVEPILEFANEGDFSGIPVGSLPLPPMENLPANEEMVKLLLNQVYIEQFWRRTETAQLNISQHINNVTLAGTLLQKIQQSRNYILAGFEYFEEADRLLAEVEYRIAFGTRVVEASRKVAPYLLLYEIIWIILLGFLIGYININETILQFNITPVLGGISIIQLLNSLAWGGLGGVVGALYALWKHVAADQDFDSQYAMWYITNPVLGVAMGAFIFMVIQAGFFSLTAGVEANANTIQSAAVVYVIAWIAGFKQNVVYEIVRRILDVFRVNTSSSSTNAEQNSSESNS